MQDSENSIINLIYLIKFKCSENDDHIRRLTPLSPAEYRALMGLQPEEHISATGFSERLGLSVSRGSRVIEKMVEGGYIKREAVHGDRRTMSISLAQRGFDVKNQIFSKMCECERKIREKLSHVEYERVESALKLLTDVF